MIGLRALPLVLVFGLLVCAQDDPINRDRQALQGSWKVVKMVSSGAERPTNGALIVFKDSTMTLTQDKQSRALGLVYALKPTGPIKEINFFPVPEPGKERSELPGIYQFTDEGLMLCVAQGDPSRLTRPTQFESKSGSTHLFLILQRAKGD